MKKQIFFLISIAFIFAACENNRFTFFKTFENDCWNVEDSLVFKHQVTDNQTAKLAIEGTYLESYSFQNIYLRINLKSPSGRDTNYVVLDTLMDKLGKWRGEVGKKHTLQMQDTLSLSFPEKGEHQITIHQYMRKDTLCGVASLGVNIF